MDLQTILTIVGVVGVPAIGYAVAFVNKLAKRLDDIEKDIIKVRHEGEQSDQNIKKHILNCVNYKPRHDID